MSIFLRRALVGKFLLVLLLATATPAMAVFGLFEDKPVDEQERIETMEKIQDVQQKLKLLQEKLKVLERRKAAKEAGDQATIPADLLAPTNWQAIDETTINPGEFGTYTYLLFVGDLEDTAAVGLLEDLILTIETLPAVDIPTNVGNRFLVPVEEPQSMVPLGRQPYNFKLSTAYLKRFGLELMDKGPILVTTAVPIDPYATGAMPDFLVVNLRTLTPEKNRTLLDRWHQYEKSPAEINGYSLATLSLELLNGTGATLVDRNDNRVLIDFRR